MRVPNQTEKEDELAKIAGFLGFPIDKLRIRCAFLISFNKKVLDKGFSVIT